MMFSMILIFGPNLQIFLVDGLLAIVFKARLLADQSDRFEANEMREISAKAKTENAELSDAWHKLDTGEWKIEDFLDNMAKFEEELGNVIIYIFNHLFCLFP